MKGIDRLLQSLRIQQAVPWIPRGARVLDVGCFDASLFQKLGPRLGYGVGIDPLIMTRERGERFELVPGHFPDDLPRVEAFDVVTFLAVLEHLPGEEVATWAHACRQLLRPGGLVVATVPGPAVDPILATLIRLRVLHGMEVDQHHGVEPADVARTFRAAGFKLLRWGKFQFWLNNLFVLRCSDWPSTRVSTRSRARRPGTSDSRVRPTPAT
jgi:SAM-dependent methyltransferase